MEEREGKANRGVAARFDIGFIYEFDGSHVRALSSQRYGPAVGPLERRRTDISCSLFTDFEKTIEPANHNTLEMRLACVNMDRII